MKEIANRELLYYNVKLGHRKNNKYQDGTLPMVKYLISMRVPDKIVTRVAETVPKDIDFPRLIIWVTGEV